MNKAFLLVLVAVLLVAGCAQKAQTQTQTETQTTTQTDQGNGNSDGQTTTETQTGVETQATADNPLDELLATLSMQGSAQYKVVYETEVGGETTYMTMYVKGTGRMGMMRVDTILGENMVRAHMQEEVVHICTSDAGVYTCLRMPATEDNDPSLTADVGFDSEGLKAKNARVTPDGTYMVSGMATPCYRIEVEDEPVQKVCVSAQGIMTYYDNGDTVLRATEYTSVVADSEFDLPQGAQIVDFETLYQ